MLVNLHHSLSIIWGKEALINSLNRVQAINKLITNPQVEDQEINDILARTKEAWEGVKVIFQKIKFTLWVLFAESHRITFNAASLRLVEIMNKVTQVAEKILPPPIQKKNSFFLVSLMEDDEGEEDDDYLNLETVTPDIQEKSLEEVKEEHILKLEKEVRAFKKSIEKFDNEYKTNLFSLKHDLERCKEIAKSRLENTILIDEFDKFSLELFELQDKISKQNRKAPLEETELKNLKAKVLDRETKLKVIKRIMRINYSKIGTTSPLLDLTPNALKAKTEELETLYVQRKEMEDNLHEKQKEYTSVAYK